MLLNHRFQLGIACTIPSFYGNWINLIKIYLCKFLTVIGRVKSTQNLLKIYSESTQRVTFISITI